MNKVKCKRKSASGIDSMDRAYGEGWQRVGKPYESRYDYGPNSKMGIKWKLNGDFYDYPYSNDCLWAFKGIKKI